MYNSNLDINNMIQFKFIYKKDINCIGLKEEETFDDDYDTPIQNPEVEPDEPIDPENPEVEPDEPTDPENPEVEPDEPTDPEETPKDEVTPTIMTIDAIPLDNIDSAPIHIGVWAPNGSYYHKETGEELDRTAIIPFSFIMGEPHINTLSVSKLNLPIKGFPNNNNLDTYLLLLGYVGMDNFSEGYHTREYDLEENIDYNCSYFVISNNGRMYKGSTPMLALQHALRWDKEYRISAFQAMTRYRLTYRNKYIDTADAINSTDKITLKEDYFALKDNSRSKPTSEDMAKRTSRDEAYFNKGIYVNTNIDSKIVFDPAGSIIPSSVIFSIDYNKSKY